MDHIRRDQTPQFSQPFSQILTMLAIVGGVMGLGYLAYPSVGPTFWANPYLNAFILFVFLIGVATCFHQVLSLIYSVQWIEGFASQHGPDFYGLPRNASTITLRREPWTLPESLPYGDAELKPLGGSETLNWRLVD